MKRDDTNKIQRKLRKKVNKTFIPKLFELYHNMNMNNVNSIFLNNIYFFKTMVLILIVYHYFLT